MPSAEGTFPKQGADPLYASEVNRFNPKFIGRIAYQDELNISGTTYQVIPGSVYYSGATNTAITINSMMILNDFVSHTNVSLLSLNYRMRISGAGMDFYFPVKSHNANSSLMWRSNYVLTSGAMTSSGGNIGSDYVITREAFSNNNATQFNADDFVVVGY